MLVRRRMTPLVAVNEGDLLVGTAWGRFDLLPKGEVGQVLQVGATRLVWGAGTPPHVSATDRFLGRKSAGAGPAEELTGTEATARLDVFTATLKGLAPASGGGTTNFLRADGTWAAPPGGGGGEPHNVLSATHPDTLADSVVAGDIIIGNATPRWSRLAKGAAGLVLRSGATLPEWGQVATAGIADDAVTDAKLRNSVGLSVIGRSADTAGDPADITAGTDGHVLRRSGTTLGFGTVATAGIALGAVTYDRIQNVSATDRFLGRKSAGAGVVEELTGAEATARLNVFTATLKGLAPASGGGTTNFLRADGTWAAPPGGGGEFRIVRGRIDTLGPDILQGTGFTLTKHAVGDVTITFTTAFGGVPSTTFTVEDGANVFVHIAVAPTTTTVRVQRVGSGGSGVDGKLHFITIGPF